VKYTDHLPALILHPYIIIIRTNSSLRIYHTCSKPRLTENMHPLTTTLTLTLKHNVFGMTKWRHVSRKCTDTEVHSFTVHTLW